tara:strand:- start:25841 stop:26692 length:852 start_codon:yes stop_codon:yes gene_type:complete
MSQVFINVLESVLSEMDHFNRVWFASDHSTPPPFSYQVNFPRMEFVITGEYINQIEDPEFGLTEVKVLPGDILFIPPNSWNKPEWNSDCCVLSLLFGKRQLGFSLVEKRKGEETFFDVQKHSLQTRTGHALDHILNALNTLSKEKVQHPTGGHLLMALMTYCHAMLLSPETSNQGRSEDLYQGICIYIQENFHRNISRDSIASRFNVSPNHLSRLFRQRGHMRLADYITWVRLERAKFMLTRYNFRLSEVALRCGFNDVNYFYRVFKNKLGRTPSEFRSMHNG